MKSRKTHRVLPLAILVLSAAALMCGCVVMPRRAFPKTAGTVRVRGLSAPVEIVRDRYGIPHLYGSSNEDLYFAQGYVHAQDRFWQMEFSRRVGAGRLSELFGKKLLETDIFLRTLGVRRAAEREYTLLDPQVRRYLDAYVNGVNAYITDRKPGKLGMEYSLLKLQGTDFVIEPWTAGDSLTWAKMMAWDLANNMNVERLVFSLLRTAGVEGTSYYFSPYREDMPLIISDEELDIDFSKLPDADLDDVVKSFFSSFAMGRETSVGSNSWVISGELTASGKPILANDTHLSYSMPSIFYEIGMHVVEADGSIDDSPGALQTRGFSFPGYPGMIIGHNARVAWGITDFGDDVQDLYLERINPMNPNQYEVNGTWRDMRLIHERIDIQGEREPFIHIVRETRHGPIITDRGGWKALESYGYSAGGRFPENLEVTAVSLRWTALLPGKLLNALTGMSLARDFDDFREAVRDWNGPVQNIVYADVEGNIGYQAAGIVPIRKTGEGKFPVPGWTDEFEWTGFVPYDEMPWVLNPEKGFIVTANNKATGDAYPYLLGTDVAYGYRAKRITEMIEAAAGGITVEDVKAMQSDTLDIAALEIVRYLDGLELEIGELPEILKERAPGKEKTLAKREKLEAQVSGMIEDARTALVAWDGRADRDSSEAALYGFFFVALAEETFRDQFPYERWETVSSRNMQNALYYMLQEPENVWWDDIRTPDVKETRDIILARALRNGLRSAIERLGDNMEKWKWGDVHTTEFRNASLGESGISLIENIFNRGPVASPGGNTTVNVGSWRVTEPFETYHGVATREVIDLADLGNSFMIHPTGQSGHTRHRHYDDFIEPWRNVEYHPTLWHRDDLMKRKASTLMLEPER